MSPDSLPESATPRRVSHPGPAVGPRLAHAQAGGARALRLTLPPGALLQDALAEACEAAGVRSAVMTLLGGTFAELAFCLPIPGSGDGVVATYGDPVTVAGVRLVSGSATLGRAEDDAPLLHCHASFCGADGRVQGGHLLGQRTRIGAEPVVVRLTPLDGVGLRLAFDPETRLHKMRPLAQGCDD